MRSAVLTAIALVIVVAATALAASGVSVPTLQEFADLSSRVAELESEVFGTDEPTPTPDPTETSTSSPTPTPTPSPTPTPTSDPTESPNPDPNATFSGDVSLSDGFTVPAGETWSFDPNTSTTVTVDANVVVEGTLQMKPASSDVVHTLRFVDVDEHAFVGGGMEVLDSDVGLWVMGSGVLDARGTSKTSWTKMAGADAGGMNFELADAPTNWSVGDRILVTPTAHGATTPGSFDTRVITAIDGATVTVDEDLPARPAIAGQTAEVANLTRNVVIEGTGDGSQSPDTNGRAHVIIMSDVPQTITHTAFRLLGPREPHGEHTEGVHGRYPLHMHMMGDAARGSLIEGAVVEQGGNHAFVAHASHGVTTRDSVAYDVWEDAFWWDDGGDNANDSFDIVWDRNLVAVVRDDPSFRGTRLAAYQLGDGDFSTLTNSVATGVQGNKDASGYKWPEHDHAVWAFHDNVAHNNKVDGIFVWQNDSLDHVIERFTAYHNGGAGVDHGAYKNQYVYRDLLLIGNHNSRSIFHRASGGREGQTWDRVTVDTTLTLGHHNLEAQGPVVYTDLLLQGDAHVWVNESGKRAVFEFRSTAAEFDLSRSDFKIDNCISDISVHNSDGTSFTVC